MVPYVQDVAAQVDYIHIIKCTELNAERIASGELDRQSSDHFLAFPSTSFKQHSDASNR